MDPRVITPDSQVRDISADEIVQSTVLFHSRAKGPVEIRVHSRVCADVVRLLQDRMLRVIPLSRGYSNTWYLVIDKLDSFLDLSKIQMHQLHFVYHI